VAQPDDQRLLSDLRAGRSGACAELVRAHYRKVYRFLFHLTGNVHLAEDLTQETFTTAWRCIAKYRGQATLATWLHRIAYTKFIDAQRANRRAKIMLERISSREVPSADPHAAASTDDEVQRLYQALHSLEDAERTVLVSHYLQGLSYREMAAVLDEPVGTVKWRVSKALSRLRNLFTDEICDHARRKTS